MKKKKKNTDVIFSPVAAGLQFYCKMIFGVFEKHFQKTQYVEHQ